MSATGQEHPSTQSSYNVRFPADSRHGGGPFVVQPRTTSGLSNLYRELINHLVNERQQPRRGFEGECFRCLRAAGVIRRSLRRTMATLIYRRTGNLRAALAPSRKRKYQALFDKLVRAGEKGRRDFQTQRFRRFEINDEQEFGRLLNRKLGGLRPFRIRST